MVTDWTFGKVWQARQALVDFDAIAAPMAWLQWKGEKKALEATEKSKPLSCEMTEDSVTPKKAAPAQEPEAASSKPDAAEESAVDCCAICLTGLEPTGAFVFEGCRCRSCVCAACQFANDARARTHSHTRARTRTNTHTTNTNTNTSKQNTHTHTAGMRSTASALARG